MNFDGLGAASFEAGSFNVSDKLSALSKSFDSSIATKYDSYIGMPDSVDGNISRWLGVNMNDVAANFAAARSTVMTTVKQMYSGTALSDGTTSLGLERISQWKVNPDYVKANLKQHAGYAAEVVSTAKENLQAKLNNSETKTYRMDDFPGEHNNQYVDKVRVDSSGNIIERIQVKFVGKDAKACLSKLMSKGYDKYFQDGKVDKMEVPKDYYDDLKKLVSKKINSLEEQVQHIKEQGNTEALQTKESELERCRKIDKMLEKSTVTSDEAMEAVKHPKRLSAKLFAKDSFLESNKAGLDSAAIAASITVAVSTIDNVGQVMDGKITPQEAFLDVAKDTGAAGGIAYGTAFVSTAVAQTMSSSAHQMIRVLGNSGVPAMVISVGVQSFDSITDFATGAIDAKELVSDLAESSAQVAGSVAGSALAGATIGSVIPGAGTAVGFVAGGAVSLVGGMVGAAVATEAYKSAVSVAAPGAEVLADKAKENAMKAVELAKEVMPDHVGDVVDAWNNFWTESTRPGIDFDFDKLPSGGLIVNDEMTPSIADLLKQTDRGLIGAQL